MKTQAKILSGAGDKSLYGREDRHFSPGKVAGYRSYVEVVCRNIKANRPRLLRFVTKNPAPLDLIKLGGGTCTAYLLIKNEVPLGRHVCVDISGSRMQTLFEQSASVIGADARGVEFLEADFTCELPIESNSFDIVLFDDALHHSRNIWTTLGESRRILRESGAVVALREAMLAPMTYKCALRRLLNSPEVRAGVAENCYLRDQYEYYLRVSGFEPQFFPAIPNRAISLLTPLNSLVISKWAIWAPCSEKPAGPTR